VYVYVTGEPGKVPAPPPKLHKYVIGPGTPLVVVLVNVTGVPGQTVVSLVVKLTVGGGYTVIVIVYVLVDDPLVATSVTRCVPTVVKLVHGFVSTEIPDVPNVHENVVPAIGVVVFVKHTSKGAQPEVGLAVKPAVSCALAVVATHNVTNIMNRYRDFTIL
jgi:hypothetical protein